jgi:hypothetical protein
VEVGKRGLFTAGAFSTMVVVNSLIEAMDTSMNEAFEARKAA